MTDFLITIFANCWRLPLNVFENWSRLMPKKKKLRSFIVRMRSTVVEDYIVDARDEDEARKKVENGEGDLSCEVERPDWKVTDVTSND